MYLVGSSGALYAAAEKAAAAGRNCMWASVLDRLDAVGALGPSLQVSCAVLGKMAPRKEQKNAYSRAVHKVLHDATPVISHGPNYYA